MIDPGKLNCRVTVESKGTTQGNPFSTPQTTWTSVLTAWASVNSLTSKEVYALGSGFTAQVTHKVTMRWSATPLKAGMRVVYRDQTFVVQAVQSDSQRTQTDLICEEEVSK